MSDKTIKHFIFMRFFNVQAPKYPYDVLDVNFLSKQLPLTKNIFRSLENQTNKHFEPVFILHEKFFSDSKYEFIFSELQNATTLSLKFIKWKEQSSLVKDALNKYDFVIQSRMDFDDFIYKDAVADTQNKINECENILAYGYCKGYTYTYGELGSFYNHYKHVGWHSVLGSLILKSSFAKKIPFISIYGFNHGEAKLLIKNFLEKNGIEFKDKMFQQNTSTNALIYFRNEFSRWIYEFGSGKVDIPKNIITEGITKEHLAEEFGFHLELKSIK